MGNYRYLLILMLFVANSLLANNDKQGFKEYQDSLLNIVDTYADNTNEQIASCINVIRFYRGNDLKKAFDYTDKILQKAKSNNNKEYECRLMYELVRINLDKGDISNAKNVLLTTKSMTFDLNNKELLGYYYLMESVILSYEKKTLKSVDKSLLALKYFILAKDCSGMGYVYSNIGINYLYINNLKKAEEKLLQAEEMAKEVNDKRLLNFVYNNLGIVKLRQKDKKNALYYFEKSLQICNETYNLFGKISSYNNVGSIYFKEGKYEKVLEQLNSAILILENMKHTSKYATLLRNRGYVYVMLNKIDSAKIAYKKSIIISKEIKDTINIVKSKQYLAKLYFKDNNIKNSKKCLNDIFLLAKSFKTMSVLEDSYLLMGEINKNKGNYKTAYEYIEKAKIISDSLNTIDLKNKQKDLNKQIELKDKINDFEDEIKTSKKEYEDMINRQTIYGIIMVNIVVILLILTFIFFRNFKRTTDTNKLLVRHSKEIEEQKALTEISNIELQEQYVFTETLLNSIPNPIFYTTKRGVIIGCNKSFEKLVGANTKNVVLGENVKDLCNLKDSSFKCKTICDFAKIIKDDMPIEDTLVDAKSDLKNVLIYKQIILDQNKKSRAILGIVIDITEIKKAEKEVKDALHSKDKFFNIMAHDLKNPFNGVLGLSQLLMEGVTDFSIEETQRYAILINQSSVQIYNLLENLLDWARAQTGSLKTNPIEFDVDTSIVESIEFLRSSFKDKNIEVKYTKNHERKLFADKNMIQTAIRNIIANAIKFTPEKGNITIETNEENNLLKINIIDTGVGIEKENLSKILSIEHTTTEGTNNEKGTGLGLVVSKEFIVLNNGTITVDSEVNKGTTFVISIPFN